MLASLIRLAYLRQFTPSPIPRMFWRVVLRVLTAGVRRNY